MFDRIRQQVKGVLRVRLDQLELRKGFFVGLDVVAILDLVQPVRRAVVAAIVAVAVAIAVIVAADLGLVGARAALDRQQRVHRAGHGDQRPPDPPGGRDLGDALGDRRVGRDPAGVVVAGGAVVLADALQVAPHC